MPCNISKNRERFGCNSLHLFIFIFTRIKSDFLICNLDKNFGIIMREFINQTVKKYYETVYFL